LPIHLCAGAPRSVLRYGAGRLPIERRHEVESRKHVLEPVHPGGRQHSVRRQQVVDEQRRPANHKNNHNSNQHFYHLGNSYKSALTGLEKNRL